MALPVRRRLGQILVEAGTISSEQLEAALARQLTTGERIGEALIAMGAATRHDVLAALALQWKLPFLWSEEIPSVLPVVKNLSPKYLRQYTVCPVALEESTVTLATADPTNVLVLDDLRHTLGLTVKLCVATPSAISEAIERTYGHGASSALRKIVETIGHGEGDESPDDITHLQTWRSRRPLFAWRTTLSRRRSTRRRRTSTSSPSRTPSGSGTGSTACSTIRRRRRGGCRPRSSSRIKLMAEMNIAERRLPQDGRIRLTSPDRRVDIRVSTVPTFYGESIVTRLLDPSVFVPFDRLGFSAAIAQVFTRLIQKPHGILLVTGPTGSGKTTTLYAALDRSTAPTRRSSRRGSRRVPAQGHQPDPRPVRRSGSRSRAAFATSFARTRT